MKKLLLLLVVFILGSYFIYDYLADGFCPDNIYFREEHVEWGLPQQDPQVLQEVIAQPFTYLAKGRESYAFRSADGCWVLKFYKCQRLGLSFLEKKAKDFGLFQETIFEKELLKQSRANELFSSAIIAMKVIPDETGVVYCQLDPQKTSVGEVVLINGFGVKNTIDLNKTPFCLQRYGEPVLAVLQQLLDEGAIEGAKLRLLQIIALMKDRRAKGVIQFDPALIRHNNIGFLKDRAIYLDIGAFQQKKRCKGFVHEKQQLKPLVDWLKERNTELSRFLQHEVDLL